jgi:hypothetical protein
VHRLYLGPFLLLLSPTLALLLVLLTSGSAHAQQPSNDQVTVVMTEMDPFVLNDDGEPVRVVERAELTSRSAPVT